MSLTAIEKPTRTRNPERTRERLLEAGYEEIHLSGFRSASLDAILSRAGVTKGALYHHFPNKKALGCAIVDEILVRGVRERFIEPLKSNENPIAGLFALCNTFDEASTIELLEQGCPLNNLAQEMSAIDETFRKRIERVFEDWRDSLEQILRDGQSKGYVRRDRDAAQVATFMVATVEGAIGLAKCARCTAIFSQCVDGMRQYLTLLIPQDQLPKYASFGVSSETPSIQ